MNYFIVNTKLGSKHLYLQIWNSISVYKMVGIGIYFKRDRDHLVGDKSSNMRILFRTFNLTIQLILVQIEVILGD